MTWLAGLYLVAVFSALWVTRPKAKRFTVHVEHAQRGPEIDSAALIRVLSKRAAVND